MRLLALHRLVPLCRTGWLLAGVTTLSSLLLLPAAVPAQTCARTITADVVALDQVFFWNRLGAVQPQGMMYALRRDVVSTDSTTNLLRPGKVKLRSDKRPRPLVLRMNVGDCLAIEFENLLDPVPAPGGGRLLRLRRGPVRENALPQLAVPGADRAG